MIRTGWLFLLFVFEKLWLIFIPCSLNVIDVFFLFLYWFITLIFFHYLFVCLLLCLCTCPPAVIFSLPLSFSLIAFLTLSLLPSLFTSVFFSSNLQAAHFPLPSAALFAIGVGAQNGLPGYSYGAPKDPLAPSGPGGPGVETETADPISVSGYTRCLVHASVCLEWYSVGGCV